MEKFQLLLHTERYFFKTVILPSCITTKFVFGCYKFLGYLEFMHVMP